MPEFNQGFESQQKPEFIKRIEEMLSKRIDDSEGDLASAFEKASV